MANVKRPRWFKLHLEQRGIITAIENDADVGKAIKALMDYFYDGTIPNLNGGANLLFLTLKQNADESLDDYNAAVAAGRKSAAKRAEQRSFIAGKVREEAYWSEDPEEPHQIPSYEERVRRGDFS